MCLEYGWVCGLVGQWAIGWMSECMTPARTLAQICALIDHLLPTSLLPRGTNSVSHRVRNRLSEFRNRKWNILDINQAALLNTPLQHLQARGKIRRVEFGGEDPVEFGSMASAAHAVCSISAPICLCTHLPLHPSASAPICICTHLPLHPSASAPIYICTHLHLHPSASAPICICTHLHLRPSASASICTHLHLHPSASAPICICTHLHLHPSASSFICIFIHLHLHSSASYSSGATKCKPRTAACGRLRGKSEK